MDACVVCGVGTSTLLAAEERREKERKGEGAKEMGHLCMAEGERERQAEGAKNGPPEHGGESKEKKGGGGKEVAHLRMAALFLAPCFLASRLLLCSHTRLKLLLAEQLGQLSLPQLHGRHVYRQAHLMGTTKGQKPPGGVDYAGQVDQVWSNGQGR